MNRPVSLLRKIYLPKPARAAAAGPSVQATVTIKAKVRGTYGNDITISKSSSALTLSGATLAGGIDYPPGKFEIDTGQTTWSVAGDRWVGQKTNALRIIQDVTDSERGRFYCKDDGTLVWENRDKLFTPITNIAIADLNSVYVQTQGSMDVEKVYNRVVVSYIPKIDLSEGVVARAGTPITIPPYGTGTPTMRYNPNDPFNDPKATVLRLPYIDPATGQKMGAKSLDLPLEAVTDIYVTDTEDGSGFNYTPVNRNSTLRLAIADTGDGVEIQCINTAIGNLYINTLQVRGVGIVSYNPTEFIFEDTDTQVVDQVREMKLSIPLPATLNYIRALAQYFLARFKDARYRLQGLVFGDLEEGVIPGVSANIFSLNQGDMITVTDAQLGLSAVKHRIIGIQSSMRASKNMQVSLYLSLVDDKTFWMLGNSTYGKLGTTTRLAV